RAVELSPGNGAAWADFSYATTLQVRSDPTQAKSLGREAEAYANRALACSKVIPEFWVRRGVALDLRGRRVEGGGAFIEALRLAPASAAIWYYQAFHLSLDPSEPGRALAAAAFCLRLDPGNHEAQALRQRLAERSRAP
ncbi:MAG TPA: hypothetical protein VEQ65_13470, partial [Opitutus sp.]|nr:hypothetical protein [Opitutus sp.]